MTRTPPCIKYVGLFDELGRLINQANTRILQEDPDLYIYDNINFFLKSFMVLTCVYLETYLKEVGELVVNGVQDSLRNHPVPHNIIKWSVDNNKDKTYKFENFTLAISKTDIDDIVSGNVGKTINLFTKLGIDITSEPQFEANKDVVASVVTKRNNIVHHNDDAGDLSFPDLINYIDILKKYVVSIDTTVVASGLVQVTA